VKVVDFFVYKIFILNSNDSLVIQDLGYIKGILCYNY